MKDQKSANAFPRKSFFLNMFTRDIGIEDCILDLLDNSIDALIRTREIDTGTLVNPDTNAEIPSHLPTIELKYSKDKIQIIDKCGGIPINNLQNDVFTFGHSQQYQPSRLGIYGIGLKRALFKLGNYFVIESKTKEGGFQAELDIDSWSKTDDWTIPYSYISRAASLKDSGTTIKLTHLREEVKQRLSDPKIEFRIKKNSQQAYNLFLERFVRLQINDVVAKPIFIPFGESRDIEPGIDSFEKSGIRVKIFTSLAARGKQGEWAGERGGWYVSCNGRLVVFADKTELTGWGDVLPNWHTKYNGFVGIALFDSVDPSKLPWTTTKRGLNQESPIFMTARERMSLLAKPVISFLNTMYSQELVEESDSRELAQGVKESRLADVANRPQSSFKAKRKKKQKTTVKVQFDAEQDDIERIKKRLGKSNLSATSIGKYVFEYFLKRECPK